ncbi:P-type ATPase [Schizosaccharomyces japonicus yFS275]|uniref:Phospholipid-transporting ATPase n=1 Tax=Schizosaccharomyces japonicus (strain yFS275 / FY16936) TaxID=402676 RepID=B6JZB6_SCHJY|nr:P-type ATPase [Schizosaccharomyces japonicus yFS275]EEB06884.2 P-type ATPase [Schizosaccharomyces japonicus yFS275]
MLKNSAEDRRVSFNNPDNRSSEHLNRDESDNTRLNPFLASDDLEDVLGEDLDEPTPHSYKSKNPFLDDELERLHLSTGTTGLGYDPKARSSYTDDIPLETLSPTTPRRPLYRNRRSAGILVTLHSWVDYCRRALKKNEVPVENLGPRVVYINDPDANGVQKFASNKVSTSKYNIASFIPLFLAEQFSKYANLFFLLTSIIQQIPGVTPTNRYTTIGPLAVVLLVSAFKEAVEDLKRKNQDKDMNNAKAYVLEGTTFIDKRWRDIRVGDIVRVTSETNFPADIVLLASSEPEGLCYIETANLDGETNLKVKQAHPETAHLVKPVEASQLQGTLRSEQPNNSLYTYEATLRLSSIDHEISISPDQLLLRGAQLRNTPWVFGIVVFTGHETKLMKNATKSPMKRTAVEQRVNVQILFLFSVLIFLALASSLGSVITKATYGSALSYLRLNVGRAGNFFLEFLTFWILYSNLVPISLFVTLEVVRYSQAQLIGSDLDLYHEETDTPAVCRTSSLVEELGQVGHIFSDKTGTLTCNQMQFRQCSIAGIAYADTVPEDRSASNEELDADMYIYSFNDLLNNLKSSADSQAIHNFMLVLSICHTVIPERKGSNTTSEVKFQAASPDEGALVEGAAKLGYEFFSRKPRSLSVKVQGVEQNFELLNICEFNSTRKRMSVVFRCPDNKIRLYIKGADTVIMDRLSPTDNPHVEKTLHHLEDYATTGLRTLCIAMRELGEKEYEDWNATYEDAATSLDNRAQKLSDAAELIEKNLTLLGATAIEDRLQDGVPETISSLQTAGIKMWVLTGDRQETAINIGMSCKLINEDMNLVIINESTKEKTTDSILQKLSAIYRGRQNTGQIEPMALVIDGKSLEYAMEKNLEQHFYELACECKAVICCRVSPLQKALVVQLVKRNSSDILLAIGDGANDVSMIQAAHIGVGISGMEGLQAVRSSDFAIAQFRYLRKLLLVHGSWSYQRLSKLILYSYYKNISLYMTQFWFAFQNGFSGSAIYESWSISLYNVLFTVLPPLVIGIFDQFVSAPLLDRYPQLYHLGQTGSLFNSKNFCSWIANGFYHSLLLFFMTEAVFLFDGPNANGYTSGHWVWGTTLYGVVLFTVLGKAALATNIWTKYTYIAIPGSFILWLVFLPIYSTVAPAIGFSKEYYGIIPHLYGNLKFWLALILFPLTALLRDLIWKYYTRMYAPEQYHHVQEIQKYNVADYRPRMEQFQKAIRKIRQMQRMRKQRGYAFSQADEGQDRVVRAYDTTRDRGAYGEMR